MPTTTSTTASDLSILRAFEARTRAYLDEADRAHDAAERLCEAGFAGANSVRATLDHDFHPEYVPEDIELLVTAGGHSDAWQWAFQRVHLLQLIPAIEEAGIGDEMALVLSFEELARAADPALVARLDQACDETKERLETRPIQKEALELVAKIVAGR